MSQARSIEQLFGLRRALIGMLHLEALPGTPLAQRQVRQIAAAAVAEAKLYQEAGFDGLMIENMHDRPYLKRIVGPEIVAAMTVVALEVRAAVDLPLGVQVLAGADRQALAVALASGAVFVRVEGFAFAHVADEGWIEADAGDLLRYRRSIGAEQVQVWADVKKKHSAHAVTADLDLVEAAQGAEFCCADGVIITGSSTGRPADAAEVTAVAEAVAIPTLVGSGVDPQNVADYRAAAGLIVGSAVKFNGRWQEGVDLTRAVALVQAFAEAAAE